MIHEILFYLWHCPENSEFTNLFELNDFLHPGEKKLLTSILEIGMNYHKIVAFTKAILNDQTYLNEQQSSTTTTGETSKGLYICAFCSGVDSALETYRQEIIKLEQKFLQFPQLNITYILSTLEQYRDLFDVLKSIINVIKADKLHGCLLVGRLQKYVYHGIDKRNSTAEIIIRSLNKLFYGHLCNWIIYGNIDDIHNEFFIRDAKCMDENFLYPHQLLDQNSETSLMNALFKKTRINNPPLVRKFFIDWSMVPMFIDPDIAESILFMGRIVWIVKNDPKKLTDDKYEIKYKHDIWDGKAIEYYSKIEDFQSEPFNIVQFKVMIEECRIKITKYLWSVMSEEGNLIEHLQLVRDYYALGRGELFQQFITVAENHLKDTTSDHIIQNLNFIFMEISRNIYGENDKTHQRFELVLSKEHATTTNPFSKLQIKFEIKWPLHIIFHPKAMELYNQLFCYLLRIKKTQINLHKLWQNHISNKQKIDKRVWVLRQNLIFLVNNLQYYLQVDVIEAQFSILLKAVKNANEFEDIIKVHNDFISNLLSKTFVLTSDEDYVPSNKHSLYQVPALQCDEPSKVYNTIVCLLDTCDNFCFVANMWDEILTEPEVTELEGFQKQTDIVVESLSLILNSLHEKAKGQHLLQLLYQLDFNKYFSNNKQEFNLYPKRKI